MTNPTIPVANSPIDVAVYSKAIPAPAPVPTIGLKSAEKTRWDWSMGLEHGFKNIIGQRTSDQNRDRLKWQHKSNRIRHQRNMQITIDLPPDLEQDLIRQATQSNIPLQTLIVQTLRQTVHTSNCIQAQWPESILTYEGIPDVPAFESYRDDLLQPREPELL